MTLLIPRALSRTLTLAAASRRLVLPRIISTTSTVMAKRSLRAQLATSKEASPPPGADSKGTGATPPLSSLKPKPCQTCGRVITPRSKWAANWEEIKFCSDRCRSTRPGRVVATWELESAGTLNPIVKQLVSDHDDGGLVKLDVEEWVELVILDEALEQRGAKSRSSFDKSNKAKGARPPLSTLTDVEHNLELEAARIIDSECADRIADKDGAGSTLPPQLTSHPLWVSLNSAPGLRERVRRAARRLSLGFAHSNSSSDAIAKLRSHRLRLSQGSKTLATLEDLSFAKGDIQISTTHD